MSWVQLDDQIATHPKILAAGREAAWLWACAVAYCSNHLTDGHVPLAALTTMGHFKTLKEAVALADRLVEARKPGGVHGLFERHGEDFRVHDYLSHNASKEVVLKRREKAAARKAKQRAKEDDK